MQSSEERHEQPTTPISPPAVVPPVTSRSELPFTTKHLHRDVDNKLLLGVCSGLADYFDVDATLVRVAFVLVTLLAGTGALLYIALALIMPSPAMVDANPRVAARATIDEALVELRRGLERLKGVLGSGKR